MIIFATGNILYIFMTMSLNYTYANSVTQNLFKTVIATKKAMQNNYYVTFVEKFYYRQPLDRFLLYLHKHSWNLSHNFLHGLISIT